MKILTAVGMIILTIVSFIIAKKMYTTFKRPLFNPTLMSTILVILFLLLFNIPYETYMTGGKWIQTLLGPSIVALAYPLYKHKALLSENIWPVFLSIFTAVVVNFLTVCFFLWMLGYTEEMILTSLPKSVTTAVAIQISDQIGGIPSLTAVLVMIAGFTGAVIGPYLVKLCKFDHDLARGMAYGNASHAIGTTKALEHSPESGSAGSAGMILTAIFSSIMIPVLIWVFFL